MRYTLGPVFNEQILKPKCKCFWSKLSQNFREMDRNARRRKITWQFYYKEYAMARITPWPAMQESKIEVDPSTTTQPTSKFNPLYTSFQCTKTDYSASSSLKKLAHWVVRLLTVTDPIPLLEMLASNSFYCRSTLTSVRAVSSQYIKTPAGNLLNSVCGSLLLS